MRGDSLRATGPPIRPIAAHQLQSIQVMAVDPYHRCLSNVRARSWPASVSAGPANRQRIRQSTGARVTATIDKSNTKPKGICASRMTPLITPTRAAAETTFADLGVRDEIVQALKEEGVEHPFAIQELTLPLALAGDDLIGQARTGMGKTYAFGVPLLHRIAEDSNRPLTGTPRALVVVPTRELCLQVSDDLAGAAKYLTAA